MNKKLYMFLFFIIFVEGFFTLSLELLSIRQLISFVGNGTEVLSIIISAVLLPLAFGYHYGGIKYKSKFKKNSNVKIRNILRKNILIIIALSAIGFNLFTMKFFFYSFHLPQLIELTIFVLIFLALPSFLLGQTVPLISNYFSKNDISKITGKILFLSTFGSFTGSIITTLVLMRFIGVSYTLLVIETFLLLTLLLISKKKILTFIQILIIFLIILLYLKFSLNIFNIEYENNYSTTAIETLKKDNNITEKILKINNSHSSMINNKNKSFIIYNVLNDMISQYKDKKILIIGAGGFVLGLHDKNHNSITYIDIDPELKKLAETKFIKQKINGKFYAKEVRSFLNENKNKYDLIIVDAFTNKNSIPYSLLSKEFYILLKNRLNKNGTVISNMIMDFYKRDSFSRNFIKTINEVFNNVSILPLTKKMNYKYLNKKYDYINNIVIMKNINKKINSYTDDKNNCSFDKK